LNIDQLGFIDQMFHRVLFEKKLNFQLSTDVKGGKNAKFRAGLHGKLKNTIAVNSVIEHVQASRTISRCKITVQLQI
jgi:hypothetical protein